MSAAQIRVYNKGIRPIVWERSHRNGTLVIHPGKFDLFSDKKGKEIISKFKDACDETEFKSIQKKGKAEK